jgi:hypothetical protein
MDRLFDGHHIDPLSSLKTTAMISARQRPGKSATTT